jgi:hypothetical protein
MATFDELSRALIAADKAGDAQAARILAGEITRLRQTPKQEAAPDPTEGMSGFDKFRAGMGKAAYDVARGVGQMVGAVSREDVAESRRLDGPLMKTGAGTAGNVVGNIAMLAPTAMIPGANTVTGGAAIGAASGLMQPSTGTGETVGNMILGGAAGAVVPAAVRGYQAIRSTAEPFYEGGRNAIVGRALNRAAGADAPATAARLRDASAPFVGPSQGTQRTMMGEFVPGSIPTTGQAAGNPGIAALERAATATTPEMTNAVSNIMGAQNAARVESLTDLAGTGGAREFFGAAREATADQLYNEARRLGIDASKLTPEVLENIASFQQRVPNEVLSYAKELAKIKGETLDNASSLSGLHWVKKAMDGMIGKADRAGDRTMKTALTELQKDLLTGMDNLSPAYQNARQTYAAMSRPINQMDVAQEIADKSINKLTGNLQPSAYARSLTDNTAARATGMPSATLDSVMEPSQMNRLNSILLDVQRANAAQTAGRGAGSDTVQKLAYSNILDGAGVPTFLRDMKPAQMVGGVAGRAADSLYGRANRELANRLAEVTLDPAMAAELMTQMTPRDLNRMLMLAQRGASGVALSAPGAANAQK